MSRENRQYGVRASTEVVSIRSRLDEPGEHPIFTGPATYWRFNPLPAR